MRSVYYLLILSATFFTVHPLFSQQLVNRRINRETLSWFRYRLVLPVNEKWAFQQEVEERLQVFPLQQSEFRFRSHLLYQLGNGWEAEIAFAPIWELNELPNSEERTPQLEIRFHQQLSYTHLVGTRFAMQHAYRIEQRFLRNENEQGYYRDAGMSFAYMRYRYELELEYKLSKKIALEVVEEVVFQTGPQARPVLNPFYRNELALGVEYLITEHLGIKAQYSYRYKLEGIEEVEHQHIARFTLEHVLLLNKD